MTEPCGRRFDEALLSGYLDGVLTQGDAQRVRVHIEDCGDCRETVEELAMIRRTAMSTEFKVPEDDQWDERPRGAGSGLAFSVGWLMLLLWSVGVAGFAIAEAWQSTQGWGERLLAFGGISGVALLFLSVAIDRLKSRRTDRYRRIEK